MKRLMSTLLVLTVLMIPASDAFAASVSNSQISNGANSVTADIATLNNCYIDTSIITNINTTPAGNEYTLDYNGVDETVSLERNGNGSVTILASDGAKSNVITFENDGSLILDGFKVQVNKMAATGADSKDLLRGTTWKGTKSLSPYGSLRESDYNNFLTSGKENIALGKALDNLTVTALSAVIGATNGFVGIAVSLSSIAREVYNVLTNVNPKTEYLGCYCTTYTASYDNYKYINKFYANKECTGTYCKEISYEHFIVK